MPEMLARYEFKYLISPEQIEAVRHWAKAHCDPDSYGVDGKYAVNSVYLDTLDWKLARQTLEGVRNRFKLRMRTYGWSEEDPVFLEIKGRVGTSILKQRALVARSVARGLCLDSPVPDGGYVALKASHQEDFLKFRNRMDYLDLRPRLWVRYKREAYGSSYGDGARLTFDTDLEVQVPSLAQPFDPDPDEWQPVPLDGENCILEMKFNGAFPLWMLRAVQTCRLNRVSCAKYVSGVLISGHLPWASTERGERWTAF